MKGHKDDTLEVEIAGVKFRYVQNRMGRTKPTEESRERVQKQLYDMLARINAKEEDYKKIFVDGVETKLYTAGKTPTQEEVEHHMQEIRNGHLAVHIESVKDDNGKTTGVMAYYYDDLKDTPRAKAAKLTLECMDEYKANSEGMDSNVLDAELDYLANIMEQLMSYKKYADLIALDPRTYSPLLGENTWQGGRLNSREAAVLWAVDKAYTLNNSLNMMYYASLRTISEYLEMPYHLLLDYVNKTYLLNTTEK